MLSLLRFDVYGVGFLQLPVSAIAIGSVFSLLAAAPRDLLRFFDLHNLRAVLRTLMRPVAERLVLGFSTGAPGIGAGLYFRNIRPFLRNPHHHQSL